MLVSGENSGMTRGLSIWLDVLRVAATLIVVLSHLAYPRFTGTNYAYLRDWNVGSDAVIVFFVISGCVIAYAGGSRWDGIQVCLQSVNSAVFSNGAGPGPDVNF